MCVPRSPWVIALYETYYSDYPEIFSETVLSREEEDQVHDLIEASLCEIDIPLAVCENEEYVNELREKYDVEEQATEIDKTRVTSLLSSRDNWIVVFGDAIFVSDIFLTAGYVDYQFATVFLDKKLYSRRYAENLRKHLAEFSIGGAEALFESDFIEFRKMIVTYVKNYLKNEKPDLVESTQ